MGSRICLSWVALLSIGSILSFQAWAESSETLSEDDFFVTPPKVASATLLRQPINETPVAVTVIDRKMIEASGFIHIVDLLRLVPGFQVGLSGLDHVGVATYHGHSDAFPRRMQVLVDGRSVFGAIFSNIDWEDIGVQMDDIDRIEVIRGPNTTVYGANAFTAVIHIITKPAFADTTFYDRTTRGAQNTRQHVMRYVNQDKAWDYRLTMHDERSDGFANRNDETQVAGGDFRATHQITNSDTLDIQTGYSQGPMGRAGETFNFRPLGDKKVARQYQSFKWSRVLDDDTETSFRFSHSFRREQDYASAGTLSEVFPSLVSTFPTHAFEPIYTGGYHYTAQRLDAQWRYISNQQKRFHWVAGVDSRLDRLKSIVFIASDNFVSASSMRFSFNGSYSLAPNLLFQAGLMREFSNTYDYTTSGRAAVNLHVNTANSVRLAISRGYRLPSLLEEKFDWNLRFSDGTRIATLEYSAGGLHPERIISREFGYNFSPRSRRISFDVRAFRESIDNEIAEITDYNANNPSNPELGINYLGNDTLLRVNSGSTFMHGVEAQLDTQPMPLVTLHGSYMIATSDYLSHPKATRINQSTKGYPYIPAIPKYLSSLLLSLGPSHGYSMSFGIYRQSQVSWWGDGEPAAEYSRDDVRIGRNWHGRHLGAKLELIVQNLGRAYYEFDEANRFETQTYVRLSVEAE